MYWLHSPNALVPNIASLPASMLGTLLIYSARNIASLPASMLCSEHCFYARIIASFPASVLGTLLLCSARNLAFLPDLSALCLLLCFARNPASFQAPSFRLSLQLGTHMYWLHSPNPQVLSYIIFLETRHVPSLHQVLT